MFMEFKSLNDYKATRQQTNYNDTHLSDMLNDARLEALNNTKACKSTTPSKEQVLHVRTLSRVKPHKAAGQSNIRGSVLKDCAAQLANVLTDNSLSQAVVLVSFKTTIIPVQRSLETVSITPVLLH